jgi:thiol peroxidase
MANITFKGNPCTTNGELPAVGSTLPPFSLVDGELNDRTLEDFTGRRKLLSIVPSLDTGVCAKSTKIFNEQISAREGAVGLVISADLPFAQGRFCAAEGVDNVSTLSMMRSRNFAKDYGVLIEDGPLAGITARAVVVADEDNKVVYTQLVTEIGDEPDYERALAALS